MVRGTPPECELSSQTSPERKAGGSLSCHLLQPAWGDGGAEQGWGCRGTREGGCLLGAALRVCWAGERELELGPRLLPETRRPRGGPSRAWSLVCTPWETVAFPFSGFLPSSLLHSGFFFHTVSWPPLCFLHGSVASVRFLPPSCCVRRRLKGRGRSRVRERVWGCVQTRGRAPARRHASVHTGLCWGAFLPAGVGMLFLALAQGRRVNIYLS